MGRITISRKRAASLALVGCACVGIAAAGALLSGEGRVKVYDQDGNAVAELYMENDELQYDCPDGYEAYFDLVRNEVIDIVMEEEQADRESAIKKIVSDGFEIRTGFSEKAMEGILEAYDKTPDPGMGNSAVVVSDTKGCIAASYSTSSDGQNYNYVNMPAYAGSSIKPLSVYAPALENGVIDWSSLYRDSPYAMVENESGQMTEWPVNTQPYTEQMVTVEEAVATSNNAVAVKVLKDYGAQRSCDFLKDSFGIATEKEQETIQEKGEDRVLSNLALGYLEEGVTVRQMAGAYQIFANGGFYYTPHTITEIEADDGEYYTSSGKGVRVVSEETAYITNRLMRGVVLNGTGTSAQIEGIDVCGKTGTSDYGDHWFAGITPEYVCTVWYEEVSEGSTTDSSVQIFHDVIEALDPAEDAAYPTAENVYEMQYCRESGLLRGPSCQNIGTGYYAGNNMPETCNKCK